MINDKTVKKISILFSLGFAIVAVIFMVIVSCMDSYRELFIVLFGVIMVSAGYFVSHKVIQHYKMEELKNTYTVRNNYKKFDKEVFPEDMENFNIIAEVNEEMAKWASDKTKEIAMLKANEQYRKEFLGNVSHELKTPLFNIQGYLETLIDGGKDDENVLAKYLDRADKNVSRLISIVEDLGTISKFEVGQLKLVIEKFDVVKLVLEIFDMHEIKAKQKNIELKLLNRPNEEIFVMGDNKKIFECISNLVINSINYGKEGGCTNIGIYDIENKYLIEVQDNGIGIPDDQLPRIFERFFRVDKSRSSSNGGTGLGLSIVKHILEAHGELITVKSKLGEGTTFSFTLKKSEG